jgi:transposase
MSDRGRPKRPLILTAQEREILQRWARRRTIGAIALRSRMVLACADGQANNVVAEQFGVTPKTIGKWRARFTQQRPDGLADEPRPGAPRRVTDDVTGRVLAKTLDGRPTNASRWTTRSMARATGLSQTAIMRIWMAHGLRPRKSQGHKPVTDLVGQIVRLRPTRQRQISHP